MKNLFGVLIGFALVTSLGLLWVARSRSHAPLAAEDFAHLPKGAEPKALFVAPRFSFTAQTGAPTSSESLRGQPYVANFIFTTCRTICPMLTAKMVRLQRVLAGAPVRFVSFSVDPEHDTPEALAMYARQWNPEEQRWLLLSTTTDGLAQVADGFHVTAQKTDGGIDAVMHSAVFVLVDEKGVVRGIYDSDEPADFKHLEGAVRALTGAQQVDQKEERSGEVLFHELSCTNCHSNEALAPSLGGLVGRRVELENGLLITADEAYVRESILSPDAKRVKGFPLKMPSYAGQLSESELNRLVQFAMNLKPDIRGVSDIQVAIDPVCHMKVRVTPDALSHSEDGGSPRYFCSEWCRSRYRENSGAFPE
jgi:protein SCO1/2